MNVNMIMTIIGWVVTIIEVPGAIYYIVSKIRNRKNISWKKIMKKGVVDLSKKVDTINPDYIVTFSGRGSIVCSLVAAAMDNKYPVYMCLLKRRYLDDFLNPQNWTSFGTSKWTIYVPDEVLNFRDKRVLIIDDITNSGETIKELTKHLIENGIDSQNIFSMSLVADVDVLRSSHIPQEYWKRVDISEYNVPWGKTETK